MILDFTKEIDFSIYINISPWQQIIIDFVKLYLSDNENFRFITSGSTGKPKEIIYKKKDLQYSAKTTIQYLKLKENNKALLMLSAEYIAGKMMIIRAIEAKMKLYCISPQDNPFIKWNLLNFDFAAMVPLQVEKYYKDLSKIDKIIIGGATISPQLQKKIQLLDNQIFATYGMTETISHIALQRLNGKQAQTYFEVFKGIEIGLTATHCLWINYPAINDKLIVTQDVVELLDANKFRWLGRSDFVINSGGIKFQPEILEQKISDLIPHHRYFITGLPDERLGEKIVLFIESEVEIPFIYQNLSKYFENYEIPKEIIYKKQFKETKTQKIDRLAIKKQYY